MDAAALKALLQSSDIPGIQAAAEQIAAMENGHLESAAQHEQLLKLQIMLYSRVLNLQNAEGKPAAEITESYRRVASLWMRSGETERAIGQLQKALEVDDKDPDALQLLARAHLNMSEYPKAIATQEKAVEILEGRDSPDAIAAAYVQLASFFEAKGEFHQAISLLQKCSAMDSVQDVVQAEVFGKLGVISEKVGEEQQAVEALSKAHELLVKTKGPNHKKTQEIAYLLEMASS